MIFNAISIFLVLMGVLFFFGTSIGLLRFPDFYTRMHAAGKGDTLSTALLLLGCAVYSLDHNHFDTVSIQSLLKIILIIFFVFTGSPTATHAIMNVGYESGIEHWKKNDK